MEPTTVCQAECPQCIRTIEGFDQKGHLQYAITLDYVTHLIDVEFIQQLDKMFMCGNYGDPAASSFTIPIYKYFREQNPNITLGMNTNGGLQNTNWWEELASVLNQNKDYVVFSIDGLEDTNGIYRAKVNWDRVIENAKAFIGAGGTAHWDMLVYKHNEHQVQEAQALAKELGFKWFRSKVTKREINVPFLELPGNSKPATTSGAIECHAMKENSVFLNATGLWSPCCWLMDKKHHHFNMLQLSEYFNYVLENPCDTCKATCSITNSQTPFTNQWKTETQL